MNEILFDYKESMEMGCNDLTRLLGESRISSTLTSLKSMTELRNMDGLALLTSGGAVAFSQSSNEMKVGFLAGAGVIAVATVLIRGYNERKREIRENPFSYVFYVNRWNGFK
ncbi:hypothetical protein [Tumebacillus lipolyticus]|uniref:Uncharacterized protein n=1 Tax=Tumebacillus lipolyticus TaxID=1280370 RepID=A0ABW5A0B0_9BACL